MLFLISTFRSNYTNQNSIYDILRDSNFYHLVDFKITPDELKRTLLSSLMTDHCFSLFIIHFPLVVFSYIFLSNPRSDFVVSKFYS